MKIRIYFFILFAGAVLFIACSGNNNSGNKAPAAEVKDISDSNKNADEVFKKQIVGTWTSFESVRGETILFEDNGKYSGYDGRDEYEGNWEIKNHKINLSLGGLFALDIKADTLYLDSLKYMRQAQVLTDMNK
ncbi:MAG: hypothetical protein V1904_06620 [Bacteroidota bacterium]